MTPIRWTVTGLLVFVCLWVAYAALAPFVFDGHLYRIEQPIHVVSVSEDSVRLRVSRRALLSMSATCSRELVCEQVHLLPDASCPIQKGSTTFEFDFALPNGAQGECVLQGIVSYRVAGAPLSHAWKSESFTVRERKDQ